MERPTQLALPSQMSMTSNPDQPDTPSMPSPPPVPAPTPLPYRAPGPEPKSQWITDDDPRHRWFVLLLIIAAPFVAVCGFLESLLSIVRYLIGW